MANVLKCYDSTCEYNVGGAFCDAVEIMIGCSGNCITRLEKDEEDESDE